MKLQKRYTVNELKAEARHFISRFASKEGENTKVQALDEHRLGPLFTSSIHTPLFSLLHLPHPGQHTHNTWIPTQLPIFTHIIDLFMLAYSHRSARRTGEERDGKRSAARGREISSISHDLKLQ